MSTVRRPDHRSEHRAARGGHATGLRHVLTHLITPLLMCVGMGLAYLGAFAHPAPHHLPVAVVGQGRSAQLLAQSINDKAGGDLDVRTVGDRSAAVERLRHQDIFGAYVIPAHGAKGAARTEGTADATVAKGASHGADRAGEAGAASASAGTSGAGGVAGPGKPAPELLVATAASDSSATVVQKVFTPIAAQQGAPLKVTDVAPTAEDDPTGQGIFFLLVAISIGSYASVAVIGGAGAVLPLRLRAALALGTSFVVGLIAMSTSTATDCRDTSGRWCGGWSSAW
ncbi:hypothetical protein [Streptomyces sp. Isolate_219]|uniref:hypothetical protein n=1 Tax=Streptomyces sp. Isolate_219 TaxID=2950110 RepID=UPI003967487D